MAVHVLLTFLILVLCVSSVAADIIATIQGYTSPATVLIKDNLLYILLGFVGVLALVQIIGMMVQKFKGNNGRPNSAKVAPVNNDYYDEDDYM